jgi:hypothetical protein
LQELNRLGVPHAVQTPRAEAPVSLKVLVPQAVLLLRCHHYLDDCTHTGEQRSG